MPRANRGAHLKWVKSRQTFYICWFEAGQIRKRSTGTADRSEAEILLGEFIANRIAIADGGPKDPKFVLITDVLAYYLQKHAPSIASPKRAAHAVEKLTPYWHQFNVAQISKQTCHSYFTFRGKSPGTVRRELGVLRAAINYAHDSGIITRVPKVWLPKAPPGRDRWLTRSEAARLLWAAKSGRADVRQYLPLFIILALYTGARKEAILSLRWEQIDLETRRINFKTSGPITNKRRAHIPISARLMTFLRLAHDRKLPNVEHVIHDAGRPIIDIGDSKYGSFGSACRRAGLTGVSPHTLRHTCGTWLAQRGVSLFSISGWLGHTDSRTTMLYAHHHPDFLAEAADAQNWRN